MSQVVIVGGGTAGWMAALLVQKQYPEKTVTLIESADIGILGAGEGTTPHFLNFLKDVDIPVQDLVKRCAATFKTGIAFENWSDTPSKYTHSFLNVPRLCLYDARWAHLISAEIIGGRNLDDMNFSARCTEAKKLPIMYGNYPTAKNPHEAYEELGFLGLHFNARLLAEEFKRTATARGVVRIEGKVTGFSQNDSGEITSVHLDGMSVPADFVFDCTGFARKIIGDLYKTKWNSYGDFLPMKHAIPFFMSHDNDVAPCTVSRAMKYGWVWQIPVQDRYGMGYVFDSSYISADQALEEVRQVYGDSVTSPTEFKFSPGCFEKACVKNAAAVGLSQGFVEPLEATSLWVTYLTLKDIIANNLVNAPTDSAVDQVNKTFKHRTDEVAEFLYVHYLTSRNDSEFWTEFRTRNQPRRQFSEFIARVSLDSPTADNLLMFGAASWQQVLHGLGHRTTVPVCGQALTEVTKEMFVANQTRIMQQCLPHTQVLKDLGASIQSHR